MNTGGADLLPEIGNRIQTDEPGALRKVEQEGVDDFQQNIWILEIEIDLVCTERCPHLFGTRRGIKPGQEWQGARPDHLGKIGITLHHNEIIPIVRIVSQESLEPFVPDRGMVDHRVEHQTEALTQLVDILPAADGRIHSAIIHHRESIIRCVRIEG